MGVNNFIPLTASLGYLPKKAHQERKLHLLHNSNSGLNNLKGALTIKVTFPYISRLDDVQYIKKEKTTTSPVTSTITDYR